MIDTDRWEQGSEFHWPLADGGVVATHRRPWAAQGALMGSGRDALRFVIRHGREVHGWERLWVPSYLCQHVVEALVHTGIPCSTYIDAPTQAGPDSASLRPSDGDVVLIVNYFGLRGGETLDGLALQGASLIIDHTHDPFSPWAHGSDADYAVASLRKTLPIPDGGVLWSPKGLTLPEAPPVTVERAAAAQAKWKAMRLKGHFLEGELVAKADFRALAADGEAGIARGDISGMHPATLARLDALPVGRWREQRRRNHRALVDALAGASGLEVLTGQSDSCPFSAFLVLDDAARRERVREALVEARSYPAILWPMDAPVLEGVPESHRALGARALSVHCDMRYSLSDMQRVAEVIMESLSS